MARSRDENRGAAKGPSFTKTTKELVTFITAATFANVVYQLANADRTATPLSPSRIHWQSWVLATTATVTAARFFYGNMRYLDCDLDRSPKGAFQIAVSTLDIINIVTDSLILSLLSFYVNSAASFVRVLIALFSLEILWFLVTLALDPPKQPLVELATRSQTRMHTLWQLNNLWPVITMISVLSDKSLSETSLLYIFTPVIAVNTIIDAWLGRNVYFQFADTGEPTSPDPVNQAGGSQ